MNEVYYCLSLGVICATAWLLYAVPLPVVLVILLVGCAVIVSDKIVSAISYIDLRLKKLSIRTHQTGAVSFAPIASPLAAHYAEQITTKMTIKDIEQLVSSQKGRTGIHTRTQKIER